MNFRNDYFRNRLMIGQRDAQKKRKEKKKERAFVEFSKSLFA